MKPVMIRSFRDVNIGCGCWLELNFILSNVLKSLLDRGGTKVPRELGLPEPCG